MLTKVQSSRFKVQSSKVKELKIRFCFLFFVFCFLPIASKAQCAMCRASLESTGDVSQAEAVNDGIVYLMIIPYILVAIIGFWIYRMFKKK
jgi:nitrate reductase NapE component